MVLTGLWFGLLVGLQAPESCAPAPIAVAGAPTGVAKIPVFPPERCTWSHSTTTAAARRCSSRVIS